MILSIFLTFLCLSMLLIILGFWNKFDSYLTLIGFAFLFSLSIIIINEDLEYSTGYNELYIYGNNYSDYHWDYTGNEPNPNSQAVNLFHMNNTIIYTEFEGASAKFFGYWLAVISVVGFALTLMTLKSGTKEDL